MGLGSPPPYQQVNHTHHIATPINNYTHYIIIPINILLNHTFLCFLLQITDTHSLVPHPPNEYQPKPHPPNEYPSKPHPFDDPVLIPSPLSLTPIAPPTNELLRQQATPQPVHIASSPQAVSPLSELEDNEQLMNNDTEVYIICTVCSVHVHVIYMCICSALCVIHVMYMYLCVD